MAAEPGALLTAVAGSEVEDEVLARLNSGRTLLLLDSFEQFAVLTRSLLDELLSRLDVGVRVVVASRAPLPRLLDCDEAWHRMVRLLPLAQLSRADARTYLERRGLSARSRLVEEILAATRGHPLGLSLAATLADRHHVETLTAAPEWRLVLRTLVERLHQTEEAGVRALLDAAALVREFDEATLLVISGQPAGPAPSRACAPCS